MRFLSLGLASFLVLGAIACAAGSSTSSSDEDITGSLLNAQACAVRDGYLAAPLSAFTNVSRSELPAPVQEATATDASVTTRYARFTVMGVGDVWVAVTGTTSLFYDRSGFLLARANGDASLAWQGPPTFGPLVCGASAEAGIREAGPDAPFDGPVFVPPFGLVISQVYTGGGEPNATLARDFVEIFNTTSSTQNLSGLSLQWSDADDEIGGAGDAGAAPRTVVPLPSRVIAPGGYLLVVLGANGSAGLQITGDLTIPSEFLPGFDVPSSGGKIALVRGSTPLACGGAVRCVSGPAASRVMDLVGYGNATDFEGTRPASAPVASLSIVRQNAGCSDRNDNAVDFVLQTPTPRGSSTQSVLCRPPISPEAGVGGDAGF